MANKKPDETPEHAAYRRTAIGSQLRWLAGKVEDGTLTGFNLVWDGTETVLSGESVTDVGQHISNTLAEQREAIRAHRAAVAKAQEVRAARRSETPPDEEPGGKSNLN